MDVIDEARDFANANLKECATDIITWRKKGKLFDASKIHQMDDMLESRFPNDSYQQAESIVTDMALRAVAKGKPLEPCRSPYCECDRAKCTHPGFYDARHIEPTSN